MDVAEISICYECYRIIGTELVQPTKHSPSFRVPLPHTDKDGNPCPGHEGEAIWAWQPSRHQSAPSPRGADCE